MTKQKRAEQSRLRAVQHKRQRRVRFIVFLMAVGLYVLVPLTWSAMVEFGFVKPIRTTEFKNALNVASVALLFTTLFLLNDILFKGNRKEEKIEEEPKVAETKTVAT